MKGLINLDLIIKKTTKYGKKLSKYLKKKHPKIKPRNTLIK